MTVGIGPRDDLESLVREANRRLIDDGGRLWDYSASPRWILAESDAWWLTEPVDGAVPIGALWRVPPDPAMGVGSTHVRWRDRSWAMVDWEAAPPTVRELLHEAFHAFWEPGNWDWVNQTEDGDDSLSLPESRAALRVELRAWARALTTEDHVDLAAANTVRQWRLDQLGAAERRRQDCLDLWEGMAEYSARKWAGETTAQIIEQAERGPQSSSWYRHFCYTTGPVLGWVLDLLGSDWRTELPTAGSLSALIDSAYSPSVQPLEVVLERLGYAETLAAETEAHADRARQDDLVRSRFSSAVWIPLRGSIQFDPREVRSWELGTFYRSLSIQTETQQLKASEGAIVTSDWKWVGVPSPTPPVKDTEVVDGPGWLLTISDPALMAEISWGAAPPSE